MSATPRPGGHDAPTDPPPRERLFELLKQVCCLLAEIYGHGFDYEIVGHARDNNRLAIHLPCPADGATGRDDSLKPMILQALREAPDPPTRRELALRTIGGDPHGHFNRALREMVADGEVIELPTKPLTFDMP